MDKRALLVTKHGKQHLLAPVFGVNGWNLEVAWADTDVLGTFSGDVPRRHSPLETVRRKAILGVGLGDAPWVVASEGTIRSAWPGLVYDVELVVLASRDSRTLVVGRAVGYGIRAVKFKVDSTTTEEEIIRRCADADLPRHHLLVAAPDHRDAAIGALARVDDVLDACHRLVRPQGTLIVQTDLRAHLCPSRQPVIIDAAKDLMNRMSQECPRCNAAGFGETDLIPGRSCADCGSPTQAAIAQRWVCPTCGFDEDRPIKGESASPSHCSWCNP